MAQRIVLILYCLLLVYCCLWIPWRVQIHRSADRYATVTALLIVHSLLGLQCLAECSSALWQEAEPRNRWLPMSLADDRTLGSSSSCEAQSQSGRLIDIGNIQPVAFSLRFSASLYFVFRLVGRGRLGSPPTAFGHNVVLLET
jgi:hypothetical protein